MPPAVDPSVPICVSDSFHFSSFYWRDSTNNLAALDATDDELSLYDGSSNLPVSSTSGDARLRSDTVGSDGDQVLRPPVIANPDRVKLKFYSHVLGDGTENIHFGKWDNLDTDQPGAYGRASEAMTNYMYNLSMSLLPHRAEANDFKYVDLGSGTGASAIHLAEKHSRISEATCLNLCHDQNITAKERATERNLSDRVKIVEATFDDTPCPSNHYDLTFSQDAFVHAVQKGKAYAEAYRITKPGGAFVFCDLMCGDNPDLTVIELAHFAEKNRINDWLNPSQIVKTCKEAGWADVTFIDLTTDLRISFQLMLKKVTFVLEHGDTGSNINRVLLMNYRDSICRRITQIDRGVFKWGVIHARKPVCLDIACKPPVPFKKTNHLILDNKDRMEDMEDGEDTKNKPETNVFVVDILKKMPKEKIDALPSTVELLITMSAGLDHIDMEACRARGIVVKQSGRDAITSHVVQYTLSFLILGLRDALNQLGVPFPSTGWNLNWNCDGKPLTSSTIAIVGLGLIAKNLVEEIRKLAPDTRIIYHVPSTMRDFDAESKLNLEYVAEITELAGQCDVLLPLCPLTKHTEHLVGKSVIANLKPHAGLINMSRGKVVDTDALTEALEKKSIKYALLDTTFPEPLPADHRLWGLENCFIFPHYATNTMAVREALVSEIQPIIEDHYGLGHSDERRKAEERALRYDLAVAHRLTAKYDMDMLVWNHISARYRTGCLITPGRKMWGKMTPEDLVYSSSNVTADVIHDAIYSARPDIKAIIHLHTPAATAISCLEDGFQPITQDSAYFYGKVANYDWDGLSDDASEGPQIAAAIKAVEGCNTLLMHNHGYVCFGSSVREAWVLAYYFERCCEVQLRVMQCGGKIRHPPKAVLQKAMETSYLPEFAPGVCEWEALCEEISFD
mmetsp:Transcript_21337/g.43840  ORF Transcript_21337/g.43840 Transcript_21337/m.43840 type:complete len:905 (+) Transcript_21337:130-2844(+)